MRRGNPKLFAQVRSGLLWRRCMQRLFPRNDSMTKTIQSFYYDELDSTQDEAKRLIQAGKINNIAYITTNSQTKGRGTQGREWSSPANSGIYLSIIHIPRDKDLFELTTLYTQAAGIACVEAIKEVTNIETKLKPVNDIYFNNKKLGGILVESLLQKEKIAHLITGIGINIKRTTHDLDRNIVEPVSLEEIMAKKDFNKITKEELIQTLISKICYWYEAVFNGKLDLIQQKWQDYKL